MAEDIEAIQGKPSNACCAELKKKNAKLLEKCSKLEEIKNKFRECTALIQRQYDALEKENQSLKKALEELQIQANVWKDEKERECGRCGDLEDEVSALKEEVQLLKQNSNSALQSEDTQIQENLQQEIKQLKELLDIEREQAALEKKNAELEKKIVDEALKNVEMEKKKADVALKKVEMEKKKADEALKKVEMEKKKADEALKKVEIEKKKADEALKKVEIEKKKADEALKKVEIEKKKAEEALKKVEMEKKKAEEALKKVEMEKKEADEALKKVEMERKKANEALKKVEMDKMNVSEAQKLVNVERKRAEENRLLWEKSLALEKSKCEDADRKMEEEKQRAIRERKKADLAVAKFEEQRRLAEMNLNKAMMEKNRADDLSGKLEEARNRMKKIEESHEHSSNGKSVKMHLEKDANIIKEKKRADSEKKKAKKQKKLAEAHQKTATEQKCRADQLSRELESYKLRLEELQKKQEFVSYRKYADSASLRNNDVISEIHTVKILKKQLKLEKMLVKHAQKTSKVEAVRNKMLHQEVYYLKQECLWFQQRLDMLDKSFLHEDEGIHNLEKIGNRVSTRETLCSDGYNSQVISGIHSGLGPSSKGSSQNMLQNSAMYSSSASFSDRPVVGSQERGTFSITKAAELVEDISHLNPTISSLSDKMKIRRNEHDAEAKADNSRRSPIKINSNERRVSYSGRKRILDAVESIENLYSKGEKLHQRVSEELSVLNSIFSGQEDEPANENLIDNSCRKLARPSKKRKASSEGIAGHFLQDSQVPKSVLDQKIDHNLKDNSCIKLARPSKQRKASTEGIITGHRFQDSQVPKNIVDQNIDHSDACMRASPSRFNDKKSDWCFRDGTTHISGSNQCIPRDFDEMASHDYMKLLDLDNADKESAFRRAITMPLSPMLLDVESHVDKTFEVDIPETPVCKSFLEELPNTKEVFFDFSKNRGSAAARDTHVQQIHVSGELGTSDISHSKNNETSIPSQSGTVSTHSGLLKYFVIPSDNRDNSSILRILQTVDSCMPLCSFLHPGEIFLPSILHTLLKAEELSVKEKVCVFFSLMLHGISEVGTENLANVLSDNFVHSLDAVTLHIRSALSDPYLRKMFMESCDLLELFAVIEDLFVQRKLLVRCDVSAEREGPLISSKVNLVLDGDSIVLSEVLASPDLLVAGGILLASLCSSIDHIGFVCEMSCNILSIQKLDPAVMLAILHVFAHICGTKYFALQQYSIAMTVVKSVVMFLEKQNLPNSPTSFSPLIGSKVCLCSTICPFSEGAVSMEDVALLLLENLHEYGQSHGERAGEASGLREDVLLRSPSDENFCDSIDILSLVEILASFMGWNWTFDHMIGQICEYLESHLTEGFSAAIIVLLGQLGRLGVGAGGYEDPGVKNLRTRLSAFLLETTFFKLNFSIQFAIITCLFGLTPIKFEDIVEGKTETAAATSQSIPACFIKDWFSRLSCEQQWQLRLHVAATDCSSPGQTNVLYSST